MNNAHCFKVGIIGAGVIAEVHARALRAMDGVELVAAYARRDDKAQAFAREHDCRGYADLEAFLRHPGLDVVTIASASGVHLEHTTAAARAGKHVICEKPLEITTERIDQMIRVCEENNVTLSGIFPRRFNESTQIFKQAVDEGRLGKLVLADTAVKWWRTQEYYDSGAWRGTWALDGGGALMNQSIHTVDLMLYLMGPVRRVSAFSGLEAHQGIEVEDVAVAALEFVNGARGVIQASTACYSNQGLPASIHICGDRGSIMMTDDRFSLWDLQDARPEDEQVLAKHGANADAAGAGAADPKAISFHWHQHNFENAFEALRKSETPAIDGAEGRKAVALINAIYASAQSGGAPVSLG